MSRPSVLQGVQVGAESVAGTAVAASKFLGCTDVMLKPKPRVQTFRSPGSKANTYSTQAKEHTEGSINMPAIGYNDIAYFLASLLQSVAASSQVWTHDLTTFGADTIKTLSIEKGGGSRCEKIAYGVCTGGEFRFTETEASFSGDLFGRTRTESGTPTATPTHIAPVGVSPKDVTVLVGTNVGGLAAITRPLETRFGIKNRHRAAFYLNSDASFTEHIEKAPDLSASLVVEHDSVAAGYMADLRASTQRVMRILASGPETATSSGIFYTLQITFPFIFAESDPSDVNDDYVSTFRLSPQYDTSFGGPCEVMVTNALSAL